MPALSAAFGSPSGVAYDSHGRLYISDQVHCQIRRIDKAGVVSKFAGSKTCGYGGDGGPAISALLSNPSAIAFDPEGNLLVADTGNNRIRKITSAGVITTVAGNGVLGYSGDGGPATSASLRGPEGVFADALGNIFIADSANFVVRKIDVAGVIHTVAGNGVENVSGAGDGGPATSASLGYVQAVVADSEGSFYLADDGNRVRKVNASGTITTFAGNGEAFDSGSGGVATAASIDGPRALLIQNATLYIGSALRLWSVDFATQTANIIAGTSTQGFGGDGHAATSATLSAPSGITADPSGNLVIVDSGNGRIREISSSDGSINTIAGGFLGDGGPGANASLNFSFGWGIAFDAAGNLYIADAQNNRVRKLSPAGVITTFAGTGLSGYSGDGGPAALASLTDPTGVAVDANGNVFIGDAGNGVIRKVDASGQITTFSRPGSIGLIAILPGLAVDKNGNVYASNGFSEVWKIDPSGAATLVAGNGFSVGYGGDGGPATQASLNLPAGVAVDQAGNVYIADWGNNRVRKVDTNGIISTVAGTGLLGFNGDGIAATSASVSEPTGVAVDTQGNVYVADWINARVRVIDTAGIIHTYAGSGSFGYNGDRLPVTKANIYPGAVAIGPRSIVYFVDAESFRVRRVHP